MTLLTHLMGAIQTVKQHGLRSFLTVLGILIGVAAVVTVIGVGAGSQHQALERIKSLGANLLFLSAGSTEISGVRLDDRRPILTARDIETVRRDVPEVSAAAPSVYSNQRVMHGIKYWDSLIQGTTADFLKARDWKIKSGRMFTQEELLFARKVAVLGETTARELFGPYPPLGQVILVGNTPLTVIGVLQRKGQAPGGTDQDDRIIIPLSTARLRILGLKKVNPDAINSAHIQVREAGQIDTAVTKITDILRARHRLQNSQPDDFVINDLTEIQESISDAARALGFWLAAVAAISLIVGGISIMNVMLVSVKERTREIGLRRAVGATAEDIRKQFLVEAAALSIAGGILGLLLGIGLVFFIARIRDFPFVITPGAIFLALGSAATVGILSGLYPARLASRLDPIVALRQE